MNRPDAQPLSQPPATVPPLPWKWFEFHGTAQKARSCKTISGSADEIASRTWTLEADGQLMPFKYFRQPVPPTLAPRPTLLLMHGMGLTIATFRAISGYLFQTHDLLLPDYSGFSLNTPLPLDASFKHITSTVGKILDTLEIDHFSIAGNSLGGGLCLQITLDHLQRVDRILFSNPACFPQQLPKMYRIVRYPLVGELFMTITPGEKFVGGVEYVGYADKSRFDPALRNVYLNHLSKRRSRFRLMQIIRSLPHDHADITRAPHLPYLHQIKQPTLISWGLQDPLLPKGAGERVAKALPNVTYETYADLSHMPHEEMPDRIGPRWSEFLN